MIRAAAVLAAVLLLPGVSAAYEVIFSTTPIDPAASTRTTGAMPASERSPDPGEGAIGPSGQLGPSRAPAGASVTTEPLRRKRDFPQSRLVPVAAPSGLQASGMTSTTRLAEVDTRLRGRTEALLREFGATEKDGQIVVSLPGDVLFDFDKADLRADAQPMLARMAELLTAFHAAPVVVSGHTDAMGSDAYNQGLSERRAATVSAWLQQRGIRSQRIRAEGLGESRPAAPNTRADGSDDPDGRQRNRRVEFTILKPES